jgi:hypothetical protein
MRENVRRDMGNSDIDRGTEIIGLRITGEVMWSRMKREPDY